jgi:homoserine O-acetyltransferase
MGNSLHKLVLDSIGVRSVAAVVGGSMGGMLTLEWPLCTPPGYVRSIVAIATSARHSAWCISWGEAQRQTIFADPNYNDGDYHEHAPPSAGLAAARMTAMLTYRSKQSFDARFDRRRQPTTSRSLPDPGKTNSDEKKQVNSVLPVPVSLPTPPASPANGPSTPIFAAQSYLRYQGDKFTSRFDANCYVHLTQKMDTHDITRGRFTETGEPATIADVLKGIPAGALVFGLETDGLFPVTEQQELARHMPDAKLVVLTSPDGHDGFLLEFEEMQRRLRDAWIKRFPHIFEGEPLVGIEEIAKGEHHGESMFGEVEGEDAPW